MRRVLIFLLSLLFVCINPCDASFEGLYLDAEAAILINVKTGEIVYEKNAYKPLYPASLTKMATALFVIENVASLDSKITASKEALAIVDKKTIEDPPYALEPDGTMIWFKEGEKISLKNLLYSLLVASGNDAANIIAESVSGSIPSFIEDLNEYLRSIGCGNTVFLNPHGLHHPDHKTTAYDLSLIARKGMQNPLFAKIVASECYFLAKTNMHEEKKLTQSNKLICKEHEEYYPYAFGLKIGYTSNAGSNVAAIAKNNERTLLAVTLGCKSKKHRYQAAKKLFDTAFNEQKKTRTLVKRDRIYTHNVDGASESLKSCLNKDLKVEYYPSEKKPLKAFIHWDNLSLPIQKGQKVGQVVISDEKKNTFITQDLCAIETVNKSFLGSLKSLFGFF